MNYPDYIPKVVQNHIKLRLEGDELGWRGLTHFLQIANSNLATVEREYKAEIQDRGENIDSLREKKESALLNRDNLADEVDLFKRLVSDGRMKDAYGLLVNESLTDQQYCNFIYSIWMARLDYSKYRERLGKVADLKEKIVVTSDKLAGLLRDTYEIGFGSWPTEFHSIADLLSKTDNHDFHDRNLHMWKSMRTKILGDPQSCNYREGEQAQSQEIISEGARNALRYAWGVAPKFSELLDTVSKAALEFNPSEYEMIGAAIKTRQQNKKTEYIRAFSYQLIDVCHIDLTPNIMKVIAVITEVVLTKLDIYVTYDDVRKTLASPKIKNS